MSNFTYPITLSAMTPWFKTNIVVVQGQFVTFQATGTVYPWAAQPPAIGPNGQNFKWEQSLSPNHFFCQLIGKVGPDGTPFGIGEGVSLQVSCTGYLYLTVNDGVEFSDNSGFFNVTVTVPKAVTLSPFSGNALIQSDKIDSSLMRDYGVMLTVKDEPANTSIMWTATQKQNLIAAFDNINSRLISRTGYGFKDVFGGLEIRHVTSFTNPNANKDDGGNTPAAQNGYLIEIGPVGRSGTTRISNRAFGQVGTGPYGLDVAGDQGIKATIIHELGHAFDYRSRPQPGATIPNGLFVWGQRYNLTVIRPSVLDSSTDLGRVWENPIVDPSEIVADHFLNWVFDLSAGYIITDPDVYVSTASDDARKISAYWIGGIEFIESGVSRGISAGISTWVGLAIARANQGLIALCSQNFMEVLVP